MNFQNENMPLILLMFVLLFFFINNFDGFQMVTFKENKEPVKPSPSVLLSSQSTQLINTTLDSTVRGFYDNFAILKSKMDNLTIRK